MADDQIVILDEQSFDETINQTGQPILVDFWAEWCGPCKVLAPLIEQLADEFAGKLRVGKVDVDANGDLANRFEIRSIPTLILFDEGKVVGRLIGAVPKDEICALIDARGG